MKIIELNQVSKKFKTNILYKDVSFAVEKGECIGIVGANGSGKSVLFKIITGLEDVSSGTVLVREKQVGNNNDFPKGVGLLVDQPGYIEYYDGFTNLKLLAEIQNKIDDATIKKYMQQIGLNPDDRTKVKSYSVGMKQKLGITQAIMENQDIILLDEPFNALDFKTNNEVMEILKSLKENNKTLLLTSHQHEYLEKICDKLYIIDDYNIVQFNDEIKAKYFNI